MSDDVIIDKFPQDFFQEKGYPSGFAEYFL
jgi:hypothetical protein